MALDLAVTLAYLEDIEVTKSGSAAEVVSDLRSNWAPAQFRRNSGDLGSDGECLPILEASQQFSEKIVKLIFRFQTQNLSKFQQF